MKKKLGVSSSLTKGIRDTINSVENNGDNFRFSIIKMNQVELDPENPRELSLELNDIKIGLDETGHAYEQKQQDYDALVTLAETIKLQGLINPIVVYKHFDKYRLVTGERRFLASHMLDKQDIQARILAEKPNTYDLRLLQWIENNERVDLSLRERISNIKAILDAYKEEHNLPDITAQVLEKITGLSTTQAYAYYQIFETSPQLKEAIEKGTINNLDKAALIANIKTTNIQSELLELAKNGASLKMLKEVLKNSQSKLKSQAKKKASAKRRGRVATRVNLGSTTSLNTVKGLITTIITMPKFSKYSSKFASVDWTNYDDSARAFKEFVVLLEKEFN